MGWRKLLKELGLARLISRDTGATQNGDYRYSKCNTEPEEEIPRPGEGKSLKGNNADPEVSPEHMNDLEVLEKQWIDLADKGELCVYTCLAFRIGAGGAGSSAADESVKSGWDWLPIIVSLVALQIVVPLFMLDHQIKTVGTSAPDGHIEFRLIGFILFVYSIRKMYDNALDECRAIFLEMAFEYNLPLSYVLPLVLGELINAFCGFSLCLTLFTVYCRSSHITDLIINCLAINFIGNVDSEFCSAEFKDFALEKFQNVVRVELANAVNEEETCFRSFLERSVASTLWILRVGGTLGFGTFLAFVFLLSHQAWLCGIVALPFAC